MPRPPMDPAKRQRIADAIRAGAGTRSRADIAREFEVGATTVSRIADELGLVDVWDRAGTKNATQARSADMAEVRTLTAAKLLRKANELIDQMDDAHLVFSFGGKDNDYNEHILERAPTGDLRNLMTAAAIALDKHVLLDKHDHDDSGGAAVDSWLRHIMGTGPTPI
jgi:hypothetical protein